ncbi:MAG: ABC transporter ATP-binding protein [Candidatus Sumerlaeaceae bacterium]|nr:ABC transporter ATP-binding protein [Candidatus Sumerlaeaceae bacterium]
MPVAEVTVGLLTDSTANLELISARGVTKSYISGAGPVTVLDSVYFSLPPGGVVALVGRSGTGKTTLLNILGGLDRPDSGEVLFEGRHLEAMSDEELSHFRNRSVGFVFQSFFLRTRRTALENVIVPLLFSQMGLREARRRGLEALDEVGLSALANTEIRRLSGGQRQRVAIARAICNRPRLLLADEPTGNLDTDTAREIYDLLLRYRTQQGTALVIVTHDPIATDFEIPMLTLLNGKLSAAA